MRWYRSLYWRIAFGVMAFLVIMLVVQAMLFVWAVSQSGRSLQGQTPGRFAMAVAQDVAGLLEREPSADLAVYIREQYAQYEHPFFVMMADGRLITSGSDTFPEPLIRMAKARLERPEGPRMMRPEGPMPPGAGPWPEGPRRRRPEGPPDDPNRPGRGGAGFRPGDLFERERGPFPIPIFVAGKLAGVVVVPPQAPFAFLLRRYAPILALVAVGVLVVGGALTSATIFGPARRRLLALEKAARQFGAGDLSARAPDRGGDEIAAVASAFNTMADDLAARAKALAASDRMRRQLLADVSHELNTPVTAMRGYLETLTMPELTLDEATRARYLAIVGDETARVERLIGDLMDLARLEGGGGRLRTEDVSAAQLFARVSARHERACAEAGITITSAVEPGAETVTGDGDRLEQALQNLAANAIRYAPPGTAVHLKARRSDRGVVLSVEDEGPGIPPEHVAHIFDRFYKVDAARPFDRADDTRTSSGSGLGLSIVKAIVERHGGTVTVTSRPGKTVFDVDLPRPARASASTRPATGTGEGGG
jgi:two-component system OmpR family sensor kinase